MFRRLLEGFGAEVDFWIRPSWLRKSINMVFNSLFGVACWRHIGPSQIVDQKFQMTAMAATDDDDCGGDGVCYERDCIACE